MSKSRLSQILIIFFVFVGIVVFVYAEGIGSDSEPQQMLDFNLAGYGSRGQKSWEVQGASMDIQGSDIKISDITARLYGEEEDMVLTADSGRFDKEKSVVHLRDHVKAVTDSGAQLNTDSLEWSQKKQLITTDDKVHILKENMKAVGIGIEARPDFKTAKLEKNVVVTVEEEKKTKDSGKTSKPEKRKIIITCDGPMELDYEKQFAVFHKNVKVEGNTEQGNMYADKMTVYFSSDSKQVDKIDAQGNVKIVRGENMSLSDGAIFTGADKKVVLTGRPKLVIFSEEGMNVSP